MTTLRAEPTAWQVWLAYLRFEEKPEIGKVRPVVIIDGSTAALVVAKVTTAQPQKQFSYCELEDWKQEGLLKPSRVQTLPLFTLDLADFLNNEPIGLLSTKDQMRLQEALLSDSE